MKKNITVVDWISEDETENRECSVGGLGGWFGWKKKGQRWKDFIKRVKDEKKPYYEAIRKSVVENGIRYTGVQHQDEDDGVPLFSDNTIGSFSYRAWGDLMAAIWSEEEDKDYSYMNFYC